MLCYHQGPTIASQHYYRASLPTCSRGNIHRFCPVSIGSRFSTFSPHANRKFSTSIESEWICLRLGPTFTSSLFFLHPFCKCVLLMFTAVWICHLHCAYFHIISKNAKIIMQVFGNGFVKDKKYDMRYCDLLLVHRPPRLSRFWGHEYFAETWYSGCLNCCCSCKFMSFNKIKIRFLHNWAAKIKAIMVMLVMSQTRTLTT